MLIVEGGGGNLGGERFVLHSLLSPLQLLDDGIWRFGEGQEPAEPCERPTVLTKRGRLRGWNGDAKSRAFFSVASPHSSNSRLLAGS